VCVCVFCFFSFVCVCVRERERLYMRMCACVVSFRSFVCMCVTVSTTQMFTKLVQDHGSAPNWASVIPAFAVVTACAVHDTS